MVDISINRAVHLARRDKLYIRARRLLKSPFSGQSLAKRQKFLEMLIHFLFEALAEAESALRGKGGEGAERNMLKFLELLCDAAKAANAMVQHEVLMQQDKNFLKAFMGIDVRDVLRTEVGFRKSADETVKGMRSMVAAVNEAYAKLRNEEMSSCSMDERERYRRAYKVA